MRTAQANYAIDWRSSNPERLVLRDVGPWDLYMTITNAAEWVVEQVVASGELTRGRRLLYWDSEGELTELRVENGRFAGFAPGNFL